MRGGVVDMPQTIVKKLFESLDELEKSVSLSKKTFSQVKSVDEGILQRIAYYEDVLAKQRRLANSLCDHISKERWDEVARHVKLINGLSALIHDDAKGLVAEIMDLPAAKADDLAA